MIHLKIAEATPTEISPWSMGIEARNMATRPKIWHQKSGCKEQELRNEATKTGYTPQEIILYGIEQLCNMFVCSWDGHQSLESRPIGGVDINIGRNRWWWDYQGLLYRQGDTQRARTSAGTSYHSAGLASIHSNYGRTWQIVGVSWHFFLYMPFATQPGSDWVRAPRQCMYNIWIYICIDNTRMKQVVRSFFKKKLHRLVVAIAAQTWILLFQLAILQMLW